MTAREAVRKFTPLLLVWLALHVVVLAVLAVVLRVVLGWLVHFGGVILLAAFGIWFALRLGRARGVSRAG
jgi:uncharacterized membrane protein